MKNRIHYIHALLGLSLGAALVSIAACSSGGAVLGGKPIEHAQHDGSVDVNDATDTANVPDLDASARVRPNEIGAPIRHPGEKPPSHVEIAEKEYGLKLTPEEKVRVNICSRRPWSKNVPDRDCTKDAQCGDGICDRGHCSAIYTCLNYPGAPCAADWHCRGLCIEGYCRSCVSDEECQKKAKNPYAACDIPGSHPPGRSCAESGSAPSPEEIKAMCDAAPANKKPAYCGP